MSISVKVDKCCGKEGARKPRGGLPYKSEADARRKIQIKLVAKGKRKKQTKQKFYASGNNSLIFSNDQSRIHKVTMTEDFSRFMHFAKRALKSLDHVVNALTVSSSELKFHRTVQRFKINCFSSQGRRSPLL